MKNILLTIGLFFLMLSCNRASKFVAKAKNYDLNGCVEFFTEKSFIVISDKILDTTITIIFIANRSFDKNGCLTYIEYFNQDSIMTSRMKFYKDGSSIQTNRDDEKQEISKTLLMHDNILYTETYSSLTEELLQKSWTKYNNQRIVWQKSIRLADSLYTENVYYRNAVGLDTLIKYTFGHERMEETRNIKYISFDGKGNWTERLEYSLNDTTNYIIKQRRIHYFEK